MKSSPKLWVCKSEEDVLVYDPGIQRQGSEYVLLWNTVTSKLDSYRAAVFRNWAEKADELTAANAKTAYAAWLDAKKSEEREALVRRHAKFLAERGLANTGVRDASHAKEHRVTHCYSCKEPLDNWVDTECNSCSWIICNCGACGCGYERL